MHASYKSGKWFGSIRARILLLLGFLFLVFISVAAARAYVWRGNDVAAATERLRMDARFFAERQQVVLRHTEQFLDFFINVVDIPALVANPGCAASLKRFVEQDPALANIFIADVHGTVHCNPLARGAPVNLADRSYFRTALDEAGTAIGDPLLGRFSGKWVLPFAQRFNDADGKPQGVVVVSLDLNWVNSEFNAGKYPPYMRLGLVTERGVVLARYPEPENWVGRNISSFPAFQALRAAGGEGTANVVSHDGSARLYAFSRFATTESGQIYFWITAPRDVVTAAADAQLRSDLALGLLLAAMAFAIAWIGSRRLLSDPLRRIVGTARQLRLGNHRARTGLPHSRDEIGQLALAFDEMAHQLTRFDPLTGLASEFDFSERLEAAVQEAGQAQHGLLLLCLDLQNYQQLEHTFGSEAGASLLKHIANALRTACDSATLIARRGTSEFQLLPPGGGDTGRAMELAKQLAELLGKPFQLGEHMVYPQPKIGICRFPDDGQDGRALLHSAGIALHQAQSMEGAAYAFYDPQLNQSELHKIALTNDLRHAIERAELELYYQPQTAIGSGRMVGMEALIRWRHPQHGFVAPSVFIALAESSGLIVPLGNWIAQRGLAQLRDWGAAGLLGEGITLALNVSALQMRSYDFLLRLQQLLEQTGVAPGAIEIELTESLMMNDAPETQALLRDFKQLGVRLSIDDFGTGYSSLSYLKHLTVDKLKIDKSFVDHIDTDDNDVAIVQATVAMAHKLGLDVIAEGVETPAQLEALRRLHCDQIQGYLVSKPVPPAEMTRLLEREMQQSVGAVSL